MIKQCELCKQNMEVDEKYKNAKVSHWDCVYEALEETRNKVLRLYGKVS